MLSGVVLTLGLVCLLPHPVSGHGYLWDPPQRSSMWRRGFNTPKNYDDNGLNCGGLSHQIANGYRCGVCGDPYDAPKPRAIELGGKYGSGQIVRMYMQGMDFLFQVKITANHLGWFEFRLCPVNPYTKVTQECFDKPEHRILMRNRGSYEYNSLKYDVGSQTGLINVYVRFPQDLTCDHCVLQWKYHANNSPGQQYQEEFYNCADIAILPRTQANPMWEITPEVSLLVENCRGTVAIYDGWCMQSCNTVPPYCPDSYCTCGPWVSNTMKEDFAPEVSLLIKNCRGTSPMFDGWCVYSCYNIPSFCPADYCICDE